MKYLDVVAGIVFNSQRSEVLLALRKPDQHQGNRWEFPGGKIDDGESYRDALGRELYEELGIDVVDCAARSIVEHTYADKQVRLHFWEVTEFQGKPMGREGQSLAWVMIESLSDYQFPDANQSIVNDLIAECSSQQKA